MPTMIKNHLRSWDTTTPAANSKKEMEAVLRRYGASGLTVSEDYATRRIFVGFTLPVSLQFRGTETTEVRLPVSIQEVHARLSLIGEFKRRDAAWQEAQAERVAWRHLLLLVEAALVAADSRIQTLTEAFFAHTVIDTPAGRVNAIDAVAAVRRIGSGR